MNKIDIEIIKRAIESVDLSDIEKLKTATISSEAFKQRAADAEIFYKKYFESILKIFIQKQLEFIAKEATDTDKLAFGRGTINGFALIKEWFDDQVRLSLARFEEEEEETGEIKPI